MTLKSELVGGDLRRVKFQIGINLPPISLTFLVDVNVYLTLQNMNSQRV